jgi:hypothetical protein
MAKQTKTTETTMTHETEENMGMEYPASLRKNNETLRTETCASNAGSLKLTLTAIMSQVA